jgi:phage FluMu protein Com
MPSLIDKRIECPGKVEGKDCNKLLATGHVGTGIIYRKCERCKSMVEIKASGQRVVKVK